MREKKREKKYTKQQVIEGLKSCSNIGKGCITCPFKSEGGNNCLPELCTQAYRVLTEESRASDQEKHEQKEGEGEDV